MKTDGGEAEKVDFGTAEVKSSFYRDGIQATIVAADLDWTTTNSDYTQNRTVED